MYQAQALVVPSPVVEKELAYPHVDELAAFVKKNVGEGYITADAFQILARIYQTMGLTTYRMICEKAKLDTKAKLIAEMVLNPVFSNLKIQLLVAQMLDAAISRHRLSDWLTDTAEKAEIDARRFSLFGDIDNCIFFANYCAVQFPKFALNADELLNLFSTIKKVLGKEQFAKLCNHELLSPQAKFFASICQELQRPEDQKAVFAAFTKTFTSLNLRMPAAQNWAKILIEIAALNAGSGSYYLPMTVFSIAAKSLNKDFYNEILAHIPATSLTAKLLGHLALDEAFNHYRAVNSLIKLFENTVHGDLNHETLSAFITYASVLYANDEGKFNALTLALKNMLGVDYVEKAQLEAEYQSLTKFLRAIRHDDSLDSKDLSVIYNILKRNLDALQKDTNDGLAGFIEDCQKYFKGSLPYMNIINAHLKAALGEEHFNAIQAMVTPYNPDVHMVIDIDEAFTKTSERAAKLSMDSAEDPSALALDSALAAVEAASAISRAKDPSAYAEDLELIASIASLDAPLFGAKASDGTRSRTSSSTTDPKALSNTTSSNKLGTHKTTIVGRYGNGKRSTSVATPATTSAVTAPYSSAAASLPTVAANARIRFGRTTKTVKTVIAARKVSDIDAAVATAKASKTVDYIAPAYYADFSKLIMNAIAPTQRAAISNALKLMQEAEMSLTDTQRWAICFNDLLNAYPQRIDADTLKQAFVLFSLAAGKEMYSALSRHLKHNSENADIILAANKILNEYHKGVDSFKYYGYDQSKQDAIFAELTAEFACINTDLNAGIEKLKSYLTDIQNNLVLSISEKAVLTERVIESACAYLKGPEHVAALTAVLHMLNSEFPSPAKRQALYKNYENAITYTLQTSTFDEVNKAIDAAVLYVKAHKSDMIKSTEYAYLVLRSIGLNKNLNTVQKNQLAQQFIQALTKTMSVAELEELYVNRPISLNKRLNAEKADSALAYLHGSNGFSELTKLVKNAFIAANVTLTTTVKNFLNTHRSPFSFKALFGMNTASADIIAKREQVKSATTFRNYGACDKAGAAVTPSC